jgi:hypothetical protein
MHFWQLVVDWLHKARKVLHHHVQMNTKQVMMDAVLVWLAFIMQRRQRKQASIGTESHWSWCIATSKKHFSLLRWHHSAGRQLCKRAKIQHSVLHRNKTTRRQSLVHWTSWSRKHKQQRAFLVTAVLLRQQDYGRHFILLWLLSIKAQMQRRRIEAIVNQKHVRVCLSRGFAQLRQNVQSQRAWNVCKMRALLWGQAQMTAAAFNQWHGYTTIRRMKTALRDQAMAFIECSLRKIAVWTWRLNAFDARTLQRTDAMNVRECFTAWYAWARTRSATKHRIMAATIHVKTVCAIQKWACWKKQHARRRRLNVHALALGYASNLRMMFTSWQYAFGLDLLLRQKLALFASWRQWRHGARKLRMYRIAVEDAFMKAAAHDRQRCKVTALIDWSRLTAWTIATRMATLQVMQERHRSKRLDDEVRRKALGPDEDEVQAMEISFGAWHAFYVTQLHVRQRIAKVQSHRSSSVLLMALDRWVDASLSPNRAENLRRRRHVRFTPEMKRHKKTDLHALAKACASASSGRGHSRSSRCIASGGLGQWTLKTIVWEASAALIDTLEEDSLDGGSVATTSPTRVTLLPAGDATPTSTQADIMDVAATDVSDLRCHLNIADTGSTVSPAVATLAQSRSAVHLSSSTANNTRVQHTHDQPTQLDGWRGDYSRTSSSPSKGLSCDSPMPKVGNLGHTKNNDIMQFFKIRGSAGA